MHIDTLTAPEQRVLGCLIEKRFTTPEQYPLTLNALRIACNQSTNRDPVVSYDEETVRAAAQRLSQYGLARLASGHSSRATKYRHLAEEALGLGREQLAVLSVLLLRGPQTPGELKGRTERIVRWQSLSEVDRVLSELINRGYAQRLGRRPGQKEERFTQTLGEGASVTAAPAPPAAQPPARPAPARLAPAPPQASPQSLAGAQGSGSSATSAGASAGAGGPELTARLAALEARVEQLATLLEQLTGESL